MASSCYLQGIKRFFFLLLLLLLLFLLLFFSFLFFFFFFFNFFFFLTEILSLPPEKRKSYESSLPVHMDGSCNGLQHYAALGGDVEGGTQVNLVPGERPGDVYTSVSNIVARKVAEDARNGHELAQVLDGKIERKIVKQTVMTRFVGEFWAMIVV